MKYTFGQFWNHLKNHSYAYFLAIAFIYMAFYLLYNLYEPLNAHLNEHDRLLKYLSDISMLFFTAGVFTVSLKYTQFLGIFQKEFNKAISSESFDKKLEKQLKQITFSEEFLLKQSNLDEIWEIVTLCKYEKQFPAIYPKLKKKINNELFQTDNISYYYKNFQLSYHIELLDSEFVKIIEKASLTIVRPNTDEFEWDFGVIYKDFDHEKVEADIFFDVKNISGTNFDESNIEKEKIGKEHMKKFISTPLSRKLEYHIDRNITLVQNLDRDREFSFGSDRIIDDISVKITHCDKLNVYFTTVNKNKMHHNGAYNLDDIALINRDIFLPGEKFKIFIYRKNE